MSQADKTKDQLLEELTELHQRVVELEAAEAERKKAKDALKESERKFRDLVDNSLVGIYRTNLEGKILYVNEAMIKMLEFDAPEEMMSKSVLVNYKDFEDRDRLLRILKKSGRVDSFEFDLLTKKDKTRNVLLSAVLDQDVIAGMIMDISERKQAEEALQATHEELEQQVEKRTAELVRTNKSLHQEIQERTQIEEALRESEERFRTIFEKSRDAICVIDEGGHYLMVNEAMCELTGVSREELLKTHYSVFMDVNTYDLMEEYWSQRKRKEPAPNRYEFELIRPDGDIRTVENVPAVIQLPDTPVTLAILRDVTERRRMEDALESMRSKLLNLQESERSKISRVLHDTIGQNIGILDFNLATIVEILDATSRKSISGLIDNMRNVIRETGDKLRDISSGLHPRLVQELGLVAGVHNLIDRFQGATGIEVHSSIQINELHIDESVEVNLYRIVQEALTNIVKHSKCSSVLFEMSVEDGRLGVMVKDNGTGFSLEDVSQRDIEQRGMGLFIMEERAKAIGGRLQINSESAQGTELKVEVELEST
ncbi:MAG: PAS domain S-box protein [Deltaproteobacteria bacterium]|nr:PAS domain S-box protein [Deltaproteobacteria bacterium]